MRDQGDALRIFFASGRLQIGPFACTFQKTVHPVDCLAIRVEAGGKSLVYTADTGYFDGMADFARDADLLISECSLYAPAGGEKAGHLNAEQAGLLGARSGCRTLLLTHLPLYGELERLREQAEKNYHGRLLMADKLMTIDLED